MISPSRFFWILAVLGAALGSLPSRADHEEKPLGLTLNERLEKVGRSLTKLVFDKSVLASPRPDEISFAGPLGAVCDGPQGSYAAVLHFYPGDEANKESEFSSRLFVEIDTAKNKPAEYYLKRSEKALKTWQELKALGISSVKMASPQPNTDGAPEGTLQKLKAELEQSVSEELASYSRYFPGNKDQSARSLNLVQTLAWPAQGMIYTEEHSGPEGALSAQYQVKEDKGKLRVKVWQGTWQKGKPIDVQVYYCTSPALSGLSADRRPALAGNEVEDPVGPNAHYLALASHFAKPYTLRYPLSAFPKAGTIPVRCSSPQKDFAGLLMVYSAQGSTPDGLFLHLNPEKEPSHYFLRASMAALASRSASPLLEKQSLSEKQPGVRLTEEEAKLLLGLQKAQEQFTSEEGTQYKKHLIRPLLRPYESLTGNSLVYFLDEREAPTLKEPWFAKTKEDKPFQLYQLKLTMKDEWVVRAVTGLRDSEGNLHDTQVVYCKGE